MKGVVLYIPPKLHRQLRHLAIDQDTTVQALGLEALERILEERQKRATPHCATAQAPDETTSAPR